LTARVVHGLESCRFSIHTVLKAQCVQRPGQATGRDRLQPTHASMPLLLGKGFLSTGHCKIAVLCTSSSEPPHPLRRRPVRQSIRSTGALPVSPSLRGAAGRAEGQHVAVRSSFPRAAGSTHHDC
ncbi:hypothetical protein EJB05_51291, partial [Eragrostis curvula]